MAYTPAIIGPFRVSRSLGSGSTGEVFLAERIQAFPQRVAIKVLIETEAARNCGQEANILVALDHPNIVKLIDRGTLPSGPRYLVMEYIDGPPLDEYCTAQALSLAVRLQLLVKVLDALSYAHRHLVIHADLKPANILVSGGEPKLLDFGVAQWAGHPSAGWTPAYASPEQRAGGHLTAASDIYSVGLLAKALVPEAHDRDLQSILATATHLLPDERYGSADAFKTDLQNLLEGRDISVRRATPWSTARRWVGRHRLIASMALLIALTAALALSGVVRSAARAERQRALAQAQLHTLVTLTGTLEGELYDSVGQLPQSGEAKRVLVQGAAATLAMLAAHDTKDSVLALELAHQYAKLAELRLATTPAEAHAAALDDVDKGLRLLRGIGPTEPEYPAAQRDLAALEHRYGTLAVTAR